MPASTAVLIGADCSLSGSRGSGQRQPACHLHWHRVCSGSERSASPDLVAYHVLPGVPACPPPGTRSVPALGIQGSSCRFFQVLLKILQPGSSRKVVEQLEQRLLFRYRPADFMPFTIVQGCRSLQRAHAGCHPRAAQQKLRLPLRSCGGPLDPQNSLRAPSQVGLCSNPAYIRLADSLEE